MTPRELFESIASGRTSTVEDVLAIAQGEASDFLPRVHAIAELGGNAGALLLLDAAMTEREEP